MFFSLLPLGLPGGDQVDGLPPAAIRTGSLGIPVDYGLIRKKFWVFVFLACLR